MENMTFLLLSFLNRRMAYTEFFVLWLTQDPSLHFKRLHGMWLACNVLPVCPDVDISPTLIPITITIAKGMDFALAPFYLRSLHRRFDTNLKLKIRLVSIKFWCECFVYSDVFVRDSDLVLLFLTYTTRLVFYFHKCLKTVFFYFFFKINLTLLFKRIDIKWDVFSNTSQGILHFFI